MKYSDISALTLKR